MSDAETAATEAEGEAEAVPTGDAEAPPREPDPVRDALVERLRASLGDAVVEAVVERQDVWVRVRAEDWRRVVETCRDQGFDYFCFLSGIDWKQNPTLGGRGVWDTEGGAAEEDGAGTDGDGHQTGIAGGDTRFQVLARLYSTRDHVGVTLKADLDEARPRVESITAVYRGADWHERETWEMFGFDFPGHPGLRHIYLPTEFEGHPLRKDFPLLAREVKPWPGLVDKEPIPGEEDEAEAEGGAS